MARILLITVYEPRYIGTRYLLAYAKEHGHAVHNITLKNENESEIDRVVEDHTGYQTLASNGKIILNPADSYPITDKEYSLLKEAIEAFNPDIVGLSMRSVYKHLLPKIMPVLTSLNLPKKPLLITGGYGPTLEPELFLDAGFDAVTKGEGEETLLEIANSLGNEEVLHSIQNTVWKIYTERERERESKYKKNPMRPLCKDISSFPPALYGDAYHSYIENDILHKNYDFAYQSRIYTIILGRGCIGKCTYCSGGQWTEVYRKDGQPAIKRRNRSLDSIFNEFASVDKDLFRFAYIIDELFIAHPDFMREFFIRYKKEVHLPFYLYLKYDVLLRNPDIFTLAAEAGWNETSIGIQTGSEEFAKEYYARNYKNTVFIEYIKKLHENYVTQHIQLIGGNCYETEEDFFKTIDFIQQLPYDENLIFIGIFRLKIFPTVPLAKIAPKVVSEPMPALEWYRRGMLYKLATVLPREEISRLWNDNTYKVDPYPLKDLLDSNIKRKNTELFFEKDEEWKDKHVVVWADSAKLPRLLSCLKNIKIKALVLDTESIADRVKNKFEKKYNMPIFTVTEYAKLHPDACYFIVQPHTVRFFIEKSTLLRKLKITHSQIFIHTKGIRYSKGIVRLLRIISVLFSNKEKKLEILSRC